MDVIKEYLNLIKVPFEETSQNGMPVIKLKYNDDLIAIFPPDDNSDEYHLIIAYDGKVQQGTKMSLDMASDWLYEVFIEQSPKYVYEDEPNQHLNLNGGNK